MKIPEGIIETTSEAGKFFGFVPEIFGHGSYMWLDEDGFIVFSVIHVKEEKQNQGNFKKLIKKIEEAGYKIKIPTPLGHTRTYLRKHGWKMTHEERGNSKRYSNTIEVWIRPEKEVNNEQRTD